MQTFSILKIGLFPRINNTKENCKLNNIISLCDKVVQVIFSISITKFAYLQRIIVTQM